MCSDIVNPYIKPLGYTDIMSSVEEKTSTATLIQLMEADETTKNSKPTETGETEVLQKRILIFVLVLLSVLFILLTIRGIMSIISAL